MEAQAKYGDKVPVKNMELIAKSSMPKEEKLLKLSRLYLIQMYLEEKAGEGEM